MCRVLVIENDKNIADTIIDMHILERFKDIQLVSIVSEEEALYEIKEKDIQMVFVFVSNGKEDKLINIKKLIKECHYTYFVFIYDNCSLISLRNAFRMGAFDCIQYPLYEEELVTVFERMEKSFYSKYITESMLKKINVLIDNIFWGGGNECSICEDIIMDIYSDQHKDDTEKQLLVESMKERIYFDMIYRKPWLEKFIFSRKFIYKGDFHIKDKCFIIDEWKKDFTEVSRVISKYQMLDNKLIYQIGKYVVVHVDERLTLEDLSKSVYLNKSYISHIFKKVSGISLTEFMVDVKIDRAKILLLDQKLKIYEIAEQIGYYDVEYFRKIFKDSTGVSPTEYRKMQNILGVSA